MAVHRHPSNKSGLSHHDALFRSMFSRRRVAAAYIRQVLPASLVERLDWDSLQLQPASFVDERLKLRQGDLLFSVRTLARRQLIYILIEHQSRGDRLMPFRALRYMVRLWEALIEDRPAIRRLPVVIAIVLHHGRSRWSAPVDLSELLDLDGLPRHALSHHLPTLRLVVDDVALASRAALAARDAEPLLTATLAFLTRARTSRDLVSDLEPFRTVLQRVARSRGGVATLATLWHYALQVGNYSPGVLHGFATTLGPFVEEAYMTGAQQLTRKVRKESLAEGLSKGRAEGKAELVVKQLRLKFGVLPADAAERVRKGTAKQLEAWGTRLLAAATLTEVFGKRGTSRPRRTG